MDHLHVTTLKELFKRNKISQKEVAKAIDISTTSLSQMVSGKHQPSKKHLNKICDLFDVEMITIFRKKR